MKRILISGILLIILCLCACEAIPSAPETNVNDTPGTVQEQSLKAKLLNSIEEEYGEEAKADENMTTVGMIKLAYKYADKWEAVAVEYSDKIKNLTEDVFIDKLQKLKASYDEYAKNNMDIYTEIYNLKYSGGSIVGPLCARKNYEIKKEYALELVGIYEELMFNME